MRTLLLLLALLASTAASEVRVTASCVWEDKDGYTPVLVRVEALVAPVDVRLDVILGESQATDAVHAEPGMIATRTVLVPSHSGYGSPSVRWRGGNGSGEIGVSVDIQYRNELLAVLDPRESIKLPALNTLIGAQVTASGNGRGSYHSSPTERAKRLAAGDLPDRWQGWPAWITLLTTPAGEAELRPEQREAIAGWVRAGGMLCVSNPASVENWRRSGVHATLIDPADTEQKALLTRLRAVAGEDARPADSPVPGTAELPTGWFLGIAITFAVIAGPLNLWWVRRRGQPHLLLISTPIISVVTCVILIVVGLLSDGLGRQRSVAQIVLLDPARQQATCFTASTWFCGIAPGDIRLDPEDRLLPMDEEDWQSGWRRNRPALGLDWRGGQSADSAWIPARVNRQLACTGLRPERRRLSLERNGPVWRLGNGLDRTIRELHWTAPDGNCWQVRNLAPGAEAVMERSQRAVPDPNHIISRLGLDARLALHGMGRTPGTYLAELDAPLAAIPGPDGIDVIPPLGWIAGPLAPAGATGPATPRAETF